MKRIAFATALAAFATAFWAYSPRPSHNLECYKQKLSEYEFFAGKLSDLKLKEEAGLAYEVNSSLFADYAHKHRFIHLPTGQKMRYVEGEEQPEFPDGTMLVKTFFYPKDFRKPNAGRRILETRILVKEAKGWMPLNYIWDEKQEEAVLDVSTHKIPVSWLNEKGKKQEVDYHVPNLGLCNTCHTHSGKFMPIGTTYKQLNHKDAKGNNQLSVWAKAGLIEGLSAEKLAELSKIPVWDDPKTGDVASRARAWLDANCAHCHRHGGSAQVSGLFLNAETTEPEEYGVNTAPLMRALATADRPYDIVPGHPEKSILVYRLEAEDPGVRMPKGICQTKHDEAIDLVKTWIRDMK